MAGRRPSNARDRHTRESQERARLHAARGAWHEGIIRRRTRDNLIASIAGGLIVVGAFASQAAVAQVTPAPSPSPSPSATTTIDSPSPTPDVTPSVESTESPAP